MEIKENFDTGYRVENTKDVDVLIKLLVNSNEISDRRNAATELGILQDAKAIEPLVQALGDHEDVAIFATLSLVKIGDKTVPKLRKSLQSFNEQIRGYSAEILGELAAEDAIEDLIEVIENDDSEWVRNSAVEAIGRLKSPKVIALLKKLLANEASWIVVSASLALYRMGIRENIANILMDKLYSQNELERGITSWALIEICNKSHIDRFKNMIADNTDFQLKQVIEEIVRGISLK